MGEAPELGAMGAHLPTGSQGLDVNNLLARVPSISMALGPIGWVDPMLLPPRRGTPGPPSSRPTVRSTLPLKPS
eukprot:3633783-Pleurochrysis_carterae.AAC.2